MDSTCVLIDLRRLARDCGVALSDVADFLGVSKQLLCGTYIDAPDLTREEATKITRAIYLICASRLETAEATLRNIEVNHEE